MSNPCQPFENTIDALISRRDRIKALIAKTNDQIAEKQRELDQCRRASIFGFNYWPNLEGCECLNNAKWPIVRPIVAADFDHMASLGCGVVRIMFWPQRSGFIPSHKNQQGKPFTNEFDEQTSNMVDLIRLAHERSIRVIVAFGNNYFDSGLENEKRIRKDDGEEREMIHRWWMDHYQYPKTFVDFLNDTREWINGFVNKIEASVYNSAILYYDYQNEYLLEHPYMGWYLTYLYDWSAVPKGKRGCSIMHIHKDEHDLRHQLEIGGGPEKGRRYLEYVAYHSYPALGHNPDIEGSYDSVKSQFPDSTVLLGEFGCTSDPSEERKQHDDELAQQNMVLDIATRVRNKRIPYYLNWLLWDAIHAQPHRVTSFGSNPHIPKDVLGGISSLLSLVKNPDMEEQADSAPAYWSAGGTVPFKFYSGRSYEDSATNQWYARIQVDQDSGSVWLVSHLTRGTGGKRLYVNAYIRASMDNVSMGVVEYDEDRNGIAENSGPKFTPVGWSFNNYLQRVGSWSVMLNNNTRYVIVSVGGTVRQNPSYLDVDTVSAWQHP